MKSEHARDTKLKANELWPGMTHVRFRRLCKWVRETADDLGLRDWHFTVMHTPVHEDDDPDVCARIEVIAGRRRAKITLASDFSSGHTAHEQRHYLTHELIHAHTNAVLIHAEQTLPELVRKPAMTVYYEGLKEHVEQITDALAEALAPRFPLP